MPGLWWDWIHARCGILLLFRVSNPVTSKFSQLKKILVRSIKIIIERLWRIFKLGLLKSCNVFIKIFETGMAQSQKQKLTCVWKYFVFFFQLNYVYCICHFIMINDCLKRIASCIFWTRMWLYLTNWLLDHVNVISMVT